MEQGLANIQIIKSEEKRAASIEDYQLAEANKQALIALEGEKE